ncbi:trichohyalin [Manduca sexta]|uniref:trichohyalin n=1 Tax=Manduca sexta TaxID=7130 RepID=UPI00188FE422|nr:trichohyalin [Manduca sexta]
MEVGVQTDLFVDRPATPVYVPAKTGADVATQIYPGDLFDFDLEVQPILEVLVGKTTEQSLAEVAQEEELATLREQQRRYCELRDAERAERQRLAAHHTRLHTEKVTFALYKRVARRRRTEQSQEEELATLREQQRRYCELRDAERAERQRLAAHHTRLHTEKVTFALYKRVARRRRTEQSQEEESQEEELATLREQQRRYCELRDAERAERQRLAAHHTRLHTEKVTFALYKRVARRRRTEQSQEEELATLREQQRRYCELRDAERAERQRLAAHHTRLHTEKVTFALYKRVARRRRTEQSQEEELATLREQQRRYCELRDAERAERQRLAAHHTRLHTEKVTFALYKRVARRRRTEQSQEEELATLREQQRRYCELRDAERAERQRLAAHHTRLHTEKVTFALYKRVARRRRTEQSQEEELATLREQQRRYCELRDAERAERQRLAAHHTRLHTEKVTFALYKRVARRRRTEQSQEEELATLREQQRRYCELRDAERAERQRLAAHHTRLHTEKVTFALYKRVARRRRTEQSQEEELATLREQQRRYCELRDAERAERQRLAAHHTRLHTEKVTFALYKRVARRRRTEQSQEEELATLREQQRRYCELRDAERAERQRLAAHHTRLHTEKVTFALYKRVARRRRTEQSQEEELATLREQQRRYCELRDAERAERQRLAAHHTRLHTEKVTFALYKRVARRRRTEQSQEEELATLREQQRRYCELRDAERAERQRLAAHHTRLHTEKVTFALYKRVARRRRTEQSQEEELATLREQQRRYCELRDAERAERQRLAAHHTRLHTEKVTFALYKRVARRRRTEQSQEEELATLREQQRRYCELRDAERAERQRLAAHHTRLHTEKVTFALYKRVARRRRTEQSQEEELATLREQQRRYCELRDAERAERQRLAAHHTRLHTEKVTFALYKRVARRRRTEQSQEEELATLREQQRRYCELRDAERAERQRLAAHHTRLHTEKVTFALYKRVARRRRTEQSQEEELATLREQQRRYCELRDAERAERQRLAAHHTRLHTEKVTFALYKRVARRRRTEQSQEEELATLREQQRRYCELRDAERAERQRLAAHHTRLHTEKVTFALYKRVARRRRTEQSQEEELATLREQQRRYCELRDAERAERQRLAAHHTRLRRRDSDLATLREQQRRYCELRDAERAERQRLAAHHTRLHTEKERRVSEARAARAAAEEARARAAAATLVQGYVAELLPAALAALRDQGYLLERIQRGVDEEFMPWLVSAVSQEIESIITSRDVITEIVREVVEGRGELYRAAGEHAALASPPLESLTPPSLPDLEGQDLEE